MPSHSLFGLTTIYAACCSHFFTNMRPDAKRKGLLPKQHYS
jgi:hypothetical protein